MNDQHNHLDALLAAWAERQRLDTAEAERIRSAVVAQTRPEVAATPAAPQPAGLPATWWSDFAGRMGEVMLRATGTPVPGAA